MLRLFWRLASDCPDIIKGVRPLSPNLSRNLRGFLWRQVLGKTWHSWWGLPPKPPHTLRSPHQSSARSSVFHPPGSARQAPPSRPLAGRQQAWLPSCTCWREPLYRSRNFGKREFYSQRWTTNMWPGDLQGAWIWTLWYASLAQTCVIFSSGNNVCTA